MYTTEDLQRILGKSRRQIRERLAALAAVDGLLAGQVRVGPRGRKEYSVAVLEMMRDLDAEVATDAVTLRQAAAQVAAKIRGNGNGNGDGHMAKVDGNRVQVEGQVSGEVAALRELVDHLRRENERLWALVNDRLPQLPAATESRTPLQRLWGAIFGGRS